MTALSRYAAARLLGAALTAGAEFVDAEEFVRRCGPQPPRTPADPVPSAAHMAVHFVGEKASAPLLLCAAEQQEGARTTYLLPAGTGDHAGQACLASMLQRMGHHVGIWVAADALEAGGASEAVGALISALHVQGVRRLDLIGVPADDGTNGAGGLEAQVSAVRELCAQAGVASWLIGDACGGNDIHRPLFHLRDFADGWRLDCLEPAYEVTVASGGRVSGELISALCDAAARASCLYTFSPDRYK